MIRLTDGIVIQDREVKERFVRAFGARGQNARTEETAVELRFDLRKSSLPPDVKKRLTALAGRHVTSDGVLVVASRANRSQAKNREAAHARLVALLNRAATAPKERRPTRPQVSDREVRLASKKALSTVKRSRSRRSED